MDGVQPVVDPHCHFDSRSVIDAIILAASNTVVVSQAMFPVWPRRGETLLDNFDRTFERYSGPITDTGLTVFLGLGIHPTNANFKEVQNHEVVFGALPTYLARPEVVCLGEVGLESLTEMECMVLRRQLEIARDIGKPAVIHTPGKRKDEALGKTLAILEQVSMPPDFVVLDHMTPELVPRALFGGMVGLTVKRGKLEVDDVVRILRANEGNLDRFLVNSDFGYSAGKPEDLTVVRATADRIAAEMGLDVAKAVCRDNAVRFFDNALLREHVKHMETAVNPARTFENPPKKIRV